MKPDGPCKMGLTDPCPWANKGQAQLVKRSVVDKCYKKLRWNPNVNRILTQRGFRKIRALIKIFSIRE